MTIGFVTFESVHQITNVVQLIMSVHMATNLGVWVSRKLDLFLYLCIVFLMIKHIHIFHS
jgi:hypothetical protein